MFPGGLVLLLCVHVFYTDYDGQNYDTLLISTITVVNFIMVTVEAYISKLYYKYDCHAVVHYNKPHWQKS